MLLSLDTYSLLWWLSDNNKMPRNHYTAIRNLENQVYVSAATTWEIGIKQSLGKITVPENMETVIRQSQFLPLAIEIAHTLRISTLPMIHKDPFDRILIAHAMVNNLTLVTVDQGIMKYDVKLLR